MLVVSQAEKDCDTFTTCGDCLAQFPIYGSSPANSSCQWSHGCDRGGKCIPQEGDYNREIYCYGRQEGIHEPIKCPELDQCSVSDCNKCSHSKCFWSKYVWHTSQYRKTVELSGGAWNCEKRSILNVLELLNKTQTEDSLDSKCPLPFESHLS